MHPGWADTPGIRAGLPGFARVMGPVLRTPEQGADTAVWLAAAPGGRRDDGRFWLDRRPRWEHKVPWTRLSDEEFVDGRRRPVGVVRRAHRVGRPDRDPVDRDDGPAGPAQPVKPYCSWGPMTAHSNMP